MAAQAITEEYVVDLCRRIGEGETPRKNTEISAKEFTKRMVPHLKGFLAKGYTYKEIAEFFGHVSVADLKKAVAKDMSAKKPEKKQAAKEAAKDAPAKPSTKTPAKAAAKAAGKTGRVKKA